MARENVDLVADLNDTKLRELLDKDPIAKAAIALQRREAKRLEAAIFAGTFKAGLLLWLVLGLLTAAIVLLAQ